MANGKRHLLKNKYTSLFSQNGVCHLPFAKEPNYFLDFSIPRFSFFAQKTVGRYPHCQINVFIFDSLANGKWQTTFT